MVRIRELRKEFDKYGIAVECRILDVQSGSPVGISGPSGSGKTLLCKILTGLIKDYSGKIEADGMAVKDIFRRKIGYLPSADNLYENLTVEEMLLFLSGQYGLKKGEYKARSDWFSKYFDLAGVKDRKIITLTGGERQIVKYAASVIHSPAFLVIDEPFDGLGEHGAESISGFIKALGDEGVSVIAVSSNRTLLGSFCENIETINRGKVN
jgi:ABC-2 type transport system ATP-binding protein